MGILLKKRTCTRTAQIQLVCLFIDTDQYKNPKSFELWFSTAWDWLNSCWPRQGLGGAGCSYPSPPTNLHLCQASAFAGIPFHGLGTSLPAWIAIIIQETFALSLFPFPSCCFVFQNFPRLSGQRDRSLPHLHHPLDGFVTAGNSSVASSPHITGMRSVAPMEHPTNSLPQAVPHPNPHQTAGLRMCI